MELKGLGTSQPQAACSTGEFLLPQLRPSPMCRCRRTSMAAGLGQECEHYMHTTACKRPLRLRSCSSSIPPPPLAPPPGRAAGVPTDEAPHVTPSVAVVPHADVPGLVPREPPLLQETLVHRPRADARRHDLTPEDAAGELANRPHAVARLFASLALGGLARRLARVCPAAGEVPAGAAAVGDPHHQDFAVPDDEARGGVRAAVAEVAGAAAGEVAVHPLAVVLGAGREHLLLLLGHAVGVCRNIGLATSHREIAPRLHKEMVRTWQQRGSPARANTFMTTACHRVRTSHDMQADNKGQVAYSARERVHHGEGDCGSARLTTRLLRTEDWSHNGLSQNG
eukprot:CAMPEP_0204529876 /NCGR_PEP_ID=MMETSP0661-20131031/10307_1 /ASSEMBLY_ACC=CAM_ASM_000606 /TAXON_ID=109239 /ORGANISM="Alexandrium margalefi, Strain AMGDE01CS-322" /LENGTH=338 /DNA_ID=CAMNT_0051535927 /DNA_START=185 /DNA_END=1198 /DNA_ORIENTATION=-